MSAHTLMIYMLFGNFSQVIAGTPQNRDLLDDGNSHFVSKLGEKKSSERSSKSAYKRESCLGFLEHSVEYTEWRIILDFTEDLDNLIYKDDETDRQVLPEEHPHGSA